MEKITFCINTSRNERPYLELLLQSLLNGIDINFHNIIVFVDSDNQNTTEMLIGQKETFQNLTIIKNNGEPIGYAGNINWMFQYSKTEIVSYIQSDMVISLGYDKKILSHLADNMVLSSTRVEPPLHAQFSNSINYVENFGIVPTEFKYEEFLQFSEQNQNSAKLTNYFFAPFSLYKHVWLDIGGHDVSFKKSREDSDIALRLCLTHCNLIQCWDAMVYHFSCTSSRGIEWWIQANKDKEIVRKQNDDIEMKRFVTKWGTFIHPSSYQEVEPLLKQMPEMLDKIIVTNPAIDDSKFIIL